MRFKLLRATVLVGFSLAAAFLAGALPSTRAADMHFAATLVWGTDDAKPPEGKDYKPVNPEIRNKLKELPLKWTNWYEVNRTTFAVPPGPPKSVPISPKCQLDVKNLNGSELEVSLIGKGREVMKRKQALPKGDLLVLGGNAPNSTAWLVILKRLE
jgi:hypothetical protein